MSIIVGDKQHTGADMRPRICVFCRTNKVNSREHIYRDTYSRYAGANSYSRLNYETGAAELLRNGQNPFTHRVKVVCSDCNNKWMNRLDEDVEPAAVALFEGTPYSCDEEMAANIAYWAAKTTMMRVFMDPDRGVRDHEIAHLYDHVEVPPGWSVFLGHTSWDGSLNESRWAWHDFRSEDPDTYTILPSGIAVPTIETAYVQQHSVVIGHMLLITFGVSGGPEEFNWTGKVNDAIAWLRGYTPAPMIQLWPRPAAFEWPSALPAHPFENFFPLLKALQIISDAAAGQDGTSHLNRSVFNARDRFGQPPT